MNPRLQQRVDDLPTPSFSFFDFPREIRDIIYDFSLDWNDADRHMSRMIKALERLDDPETWIIDAEELSDDELILDDDDMSISSEDEDDSFEYFKDLGVRARKFVYPRRRTPNILLLSRQTNAEANFVLFKKPFELKAIANFAFDIVCPAKFIAQIVMSNFISLETLKRIPAFRIYRNIDFQPCMAFTPIWGCMHSPLGRELGQIAPVKAHLMINLGDPHPHNTETPANKYEWRAMDIEDAELMFNSSSGQVSTQKR